MRITANRSINHRPEIIRLPVFSAREGNRRIQDQIVRVNSSNVWGYAAKIDTADSKTCTVYIQFKNSQGGPGDIYAYYDVPVVVYRRMHGAPSKGHYFWKYIRNNYLYSKLTGDKRTKLANGI